MAKYQVGNQWGGSSAPWNPGGQWQLGNRSGQYVTGIDITSSDGGKTLEGTMTYNGEGPIGFKATNLNGNVYSVDNQWGGPTAPWNPGGEWVIGGRDNQKVVQLSAKADESQNLNGTMTYQGEGSIGFKGIKLNYQVDNQWGGSSSPWNPGGAWRLGSRPDQYVTAIDITSTDGGKSFEGTMTYNGEGPIGFKATNLDGNVYTVENQWGGSSAPWNPGGEWVIGGRDNQKAVQLSAKGDESKNMNGEMTYQGEGPIGFKAALIS